MRIIGILGGVASGKSTVARQLERLGAGVLDADQTGHEVLRLPQVEAAVRRRWGEAVSAGSKRADRSRAVGSHRLRPGPEAHTERRYLEQVTHPEISRAVWRQAAAMAAAGTKIVLLDAALLLEAGWDLWCEKTVFVEAPREARLARAIARGWNEEDFVAREAAQESLDRKRGRADVIIDNSGSPEQTQAQVERFSGVPGPLIPALSAFHTELSKAIEEQPYADDHEHGVLERRNVLGGKAS